ncbi:MAG: VF530 family protein [Burkholderiaceae bacterium]|nr:VF530 family DNA-binding protein [Burkholderiaceae bacterium]
MTAPTHPPEPVPSAAPASEAQAPAPRPALQPRNPLHGVTLEAMVRALSEHYGWPGLGQKIPVRCFQVDPSVGSSLKFLRKTPWAREKVESLYLFMLREQKRSAAHGR